jgi:hypothetical protein
MLLDHAAQRLFNNSLRGFLQVLRLSCGPIQPRSSPSQVIHVAVAGVKVLCIFAALFPVEASVAVGKAAATSGSTDSKTGECLSYWLQQQQLQSDTELQGRL